jgi:translation initiation factor IF-3
MTFQSTIVVAALLLCSTASAFSHIGSSPRQSNVVLFARRDGGRGRRGAPVQAWKPPMNQEIDDRDLRVVTPTPKGKDEPLGVMTKAEALAKAKEMGGLDLILVNPNSDPPVCKIVDYSKYRYMQEKKAKEVKKNSKSSELKEIKMSYKIDIHDYAVRMKNARKFLGQGNRVKCTVMFRGREIQHDALGRNLLEKLAEDMTDLAVKEGQPKKEGRNLSLIVSPRAEVLKKVNENRRADEKAKKKQKEDEKANKAADKIADKEAIAAELTATSAELEVNGGAAADLAEEEIDLESDIESSLDDLFGSDDLTDDLFS